MRIQGLVIIGIVVSIVLSIHVTAITCSGTNRPSIPTTFDGYALNNDNSTLAEGTEIIGTHSGVTFTTTVDANGQYGIIGGPFAIEKCNNVANANISFTLGGVNAKESKLYNSGGDFQTFNLTASSTVTATTSSSSSSSSGGGSSGSSSAGGGGGGAGIIGGTTTSSSSKKSPSKYPDIQATLPKGWSEVTVTPGKIGNIVARKVDIKSIIDQAISPEAKAALEKAAAGVAGGSLMSGSASAQFEVFEILNEETGEKVARTKITVTVVGTNVEQKDVVVIEIIPKEIAASVDDITFVGNQPIILQADPIVSWNIATLGPNENREFVYVVNTKVEELTTKTVVTGTEVVGEASVVLEEPTVSSRIPITIVSVLFLVIIALGYFYWRKKQY